MGDSNLYEKQNKKLLEYEAVGNADLNKDQTELAYRHLNSGFFTLDKDRHKDQALKDWQEAHDQKKRDIEDLWHRNTATEVTDLRQRAGATNKKSRAYYRPYNLKELESFIKNSDRGGNSDQYNNVATELELYNRIMEKGNKLEGLAVLMRVYDRAEEYKGARKSPNSTKGKIRKAIVSVISEKAAEQIELQKNEYRTKADQLFEEVKEGFGTDEHVNEAFKAHYNLIYQVLNGSMELSKEEIEKLDTNTETIMQMVMKQKVDDTQGNNMSTKFFNALGWSSNEPRLVNEFELDYGKKEMNRSVIKKKMYHAINPYGGMEDAKEAGKQLAGVKKKNNRLFFGIGRFGKGIYTSARQKDPDDSLERYNMDIKAENNSWGYGKKEGAVQLMMTLNEHARMIDYREFTREKEYRFDMLFGKVARLVQSEPISAGGYKDYLTMKASFFGYNTLIDHKTMIDGVDYYVTTDRKAMTISNEMRVRTKTGSEDFYNTEDLVKEK